MNMLPNLDNENCKGVLTYVRAPLETVSSFRGKNQMERLFLPLDVWMQSCVDEEPRISVTISQTQSWHVKDGCVKRS